jgi:hypothetical protein
MNRMMTDHPKNREPDASNSDETDERKQDENQEQNDKLDEAIEMTFPASDPVSI